MSGTKERGLSVMEMVVALAIVAMTMALGMQALLQWNTAQERFSAAERRGRELQLGEEWIRTALRSRLSRSDRAADGTPIDALSGDATRLSFVTLSPVAGRRGVPTRQTWRLAEGGDGVLLAVEGGPNLRLPRGGPAAFVYIDGEGRVHERWPPARGDAAVPPALVGLSTAQGLWLEANPLRPVTVPHEDLSD